MNVETFHSKYLNQRATIVCQDGILLANCNWVSYSSYLFYVRGFYVEVWREKEREEILLIRGFTGLRGLKPYLREIDIKNIYLF